MDEFGGPFPEPEILHHKHLLSKFHFDQMPFLDIIA
jgi:hypothetical protein